MANENEEDYDLVPHQRLLELEKNVGQLKKNPLAASPAGEAMTEAMRNLDEHLRELAALFKEAVTHIRVEEEPMSKKLDPLLEKLDMVVEQNRKIARGIVAVADMLKEEQERRRTTAGSAAAAVPPGAPFPPSSPRSIPFSEAVSPSFPGEETTVRTLLEESSRTPLSTPSFPGVPPFAMPPPPPGAPLQFPRPQKKRGLFG